MIYMYRLLMHNIEHIFTKVTVMKRSSHFITTDSTVAHD